jgi:hypothetical protein
MEKVFILATFVTFLYCLMKFLEMRYVEKKMEPLRNVIRQAIFVFAATLFVGYFVIEHAHLIDGLFNVITEKKVFNESATQVFVGTPDF